MNMARRQETHSECWLTFPPLLPSKLFYLQLTAQSTTPVPLPPPFLNFFFYSYISNLFLTLAEPLCSWFIHYLRQSLRHCKRLHKKTAGVNLKQSENSPGPNLDDILLIMNKYTMEPPSWVKLHFFLEVT